MSLTADVNHKIKSVPNDHAGSILNTEFIMNKSAGNISFTVGVMVAKYLFLLSLSLFFWMFEFKYIFLIQLITLGSMIWFYRREKQIIIFLIFAFIYLYTPKYFFLDGIFLSHHLDQQSFDNYSVLIILNILFFIGFFIGLRQVSERVVSVQSLVGSLQICIYFHCS